MEDALKKIEQYADKAHGTQMRKYTPERYIVHPVRVMHMCAAYNNRLPILAAALLHDVLEDTPVTGKELHGFLKTVMSDAEADETLRLVIELTDVYVKEEYPRLNRRTRKQKELERMKDISTDAQTIKYADVIDNCNEIVAQDPDFARVFLRECGNMLQVLDKGNPALYDKARTVVNNALIGLKRKR